MVLLLPWSGRLARDVDELELEPVGVVEEDRVVAGRVEVLLRPALDLEALLPHPVRALVDDTARRGLDREVVQPDPIAVVALRRGLSLAEPDRAARPPQVPDRLAALALDLGHAVPAERPEEIAVEGQAGLDRGHDQVDVVDAARTHARRGGVHRAAGSSSRPERPRAYNSAARAALPLPPRHEPGARG